MTVGLRWPGEQVIERDAEPSKRGQCLAIERIANAEDSRRNVIFSLPPDIDTFRGWPDNPGQLRARKQPLLCFFRHLQGILRWRGHFNDEIGHETPVAA